MRRLVLILCCLALVAAAIWYFHARASPEPGAPALFARDAHSWPVCSGGCGRERWAVKTLSDPASDRVDLARVVPTTVAELAALDPRATTLVAGWRRAPVETTVYRVDAILLALLGEEDHDFHLVLEDPDRTGVTIIAEIPDPSCAGSCVSGYASYYQRARETVMAHTDNGRLSRLRPRVRVTGIGFFDFAHGQRGAAPNDFELHPVLEIEFP